MIFSIVIPTYNRAEFLKTCLDCLVAQTEKRFEVLVCDNGSTDDSKRVVESYLRRLDLKYFYLQPSGSPARPRNFGISKAQFEWICTLDSDDWWTPDKLSRVLPFTADYDLIYHRLIKTDGTRTAGELCTFGSHGAAMQTPGWESFFVYGSSIPHSSTVIRKSLLQRVGGYDESRELATVDDVDLLIRLLQAGARIKFVDADLGFFYWKAGHNLMLVDEFQPDRHEYLLKKYEKDFPTPRSLSAAKSYLDLRRASFFARRRQWNKLASIPLASLKNLNGLRDRVKLAAAIVGGRILK